MIPGWVSTREHTRYAHRSAGLFMLGVHGVLWDRPAPLRNTLNRVLRKQFHPDSFASSRNSPKP